ncbi:PREDICTED: uncharacterized protein LOC109337077 isoform X3 [Lupinus angustifolius]|uniref:uncharacterized protein LOC109337077 isoform X3 n=1 Tax=Lupinus angustifolius TaxID=3871 RepID=UPI00092FCB21|nr:PREDICTED: uncharacterized protein LOC109337077 isoform X3 [Lupinus angustifolius]
MWLRQGEPVRVLTGGRRRKDSCMRIVTLRRSTGSLCCETYATLFPYQSAGLFISLSEKLGSLSLVANTLTYCSS